MESLINKKINRWTLLGPTTRPYYWYARCDCGETYERHINSITSNKSTQCKSCGSGTHRETASRIYTIWHGICQRCENPNNVRYHRYGGRGIKMYPPWRRYTNFAMWANNSGYADNLTIDRINNDGDYCPDNCRWITNSDNSKRNMAWVMRSDGTLYRGLEYAAKEQGISASYLSTIMSSKMRRHGYRFSYCNPVQVV